MNGRTNPSFRFKTFTTLARLLIKKPRQRRIAESFLINKRAKVVNVLNRNDGLVLPSIYSMLLD